VIKVLVFTLLLNCSQSMLFQFETVLGDGLNLGRHAKPHPTFGINQTHGYISEVLALRVSWGLISHGANDDRGDHSAFESLSGYWNSNFRPVSVRFLRKNAVPEPTALLAGDKWAGAGLLQNGHFPFNRGSTCEVHIHSDCRTMPMVHQSGDNCNSAPIIFEGQVRSNFQLQGQPWASLSNAKFSSVDSHSPSGDESPPHKQNTNQGDASDPQRSYEHPISPRSHVLLGLQVILGLLVFAIGGYGFYDTLKPRKNSILAQAGPTELYAFASCACLVLGYLTALAGVILLIS